MSGTTRDERNVLKHLKRITNLWYITAVNQICILETSFEIKSRIERKRASYSNRSFISCIKDSDSEKLYNLERNIFEGSFYYEKSFINWIMIKSDPKKINDDQRGI